MISPGIQEIYADLFHMSEILTTYMRIQEISWFGETPEHLPNKTMSFVSILKIDVCIHNQQNK